MQPFTHLMRDLSKTYQKLGYTDVDEKVIRNVIKEVDVDKDGSISFDEYLDVAAGAKQVHLHNAFTDIALKDSLDDPSEEQGRQDGHRGSGEEPPQKYGVKIDYSNKMPPEKTGGGR